MYSLNKIKKEILDILNQEFGEELVFENDLVYPPDKKMGDLSFPCFVVSKELKDAPVNIAKNLFPKIEKEFSEKGLNSLVSAKLVGPYINFVFKQKIVGRILEEIDDDFGNNNFGNKERVMIEYSNVNTHKEYHVGHLRNICYGDSITKIFSANGYESIPVSYVNDFGIHVAKTVWKYLSLEKGEKERIKKLDDKGYSLGRVYVEAAQESSDDAKVKVEVSEVMKKIESRSGKEFKTWKETREWSVEYFDSIYKKLNVKFDFNFYEHQYIKDGIKLVEKLKKEGVLVKSNGAILADLEKYDLSVLVFLRSDGTALYPVADLALAVEKFKKKIDKSLYVVDNRQSLYFKQLFKVLELMGYKEEMTHLPYDFVKLPTGMMSSRSGNTISFKELYRQIFDKLKKETKVRHLNWKEERIDEVVEIMTIGILKFEMIKVGANKIITFDINSALRFDGYTSVYLQYTCARINSIIKKTKVDSRNIDFSKLKEQKEINLTLYLAKFPEIVERAGMTYQPAEIAKYLFELAKLFNEYYHNVPILKPEEKLKQARIELLLSVRQVMINGLGMLGIDIVDQM